MKATITNLRAVNARLAKYGVKITLHEVAKVDGNYYRGKQPFRAWGRHTGTSTEILGHMITACKAMGINHETGDLLPKGERR